jgi:hypothetical protein
MGKKALLQRETALLVPSTNGVLQPPRFIRLVMPPPTRQCRTEPQQGWKTTNRTQRRTEDQLEDPKAHSHTVRILAFSLHRTKGYLGILAAPSEVERLSRGALVLLGHNDAVVNGDA